ncbi:MAG: Na/Pi symporter [Fidelibacterota bacterium]
MLTKKMLSLMVSGLFSFTLLLAGNETLTIRMADKETDHVKSGDKQYNLVEEELSNPLMVKVEQAGKPVPGVSVYFQLMSSPPKAKGRVVLDSVTITDNSGLAHADIRLGSKAGEYIISAKISNSDLSANEVVFHCYGRERNWVFLLIVGLFGGLGLFLYGMDMMSEGMKKTAGNKMRTILEKLTANRVVALFVGAFVTMVIQSSSATTVMLVSFVNAGLMRFVQALGVILGADIGTTVTAQLIAFKVTDYALIMVALGAVLTIFAKKDSQRYLGEVILGFGLLFYGMHLMSQAMYPLRTYDRFIDLLLRLENPLLGILVGALFTALIQSSSAFTGIIIVLAVQGVLTLEAGIPLIMGANIGTCVTAGIASINATRDARRVALAHVMFKIMGVLLFAFWIPWFAELIRWMSPVSDLEGAAKLAAETPRQIANAHTVFNVSLAFVFLPFVNQFANLLLKILPIEEKIVDRGLKPYVMHLDKNMVETPAIAIDLVFAEIATITRLLHRMVGSVIEPFLRRLDQPDVSHPELTLIEGIHMREEKIDFLQEQVSDYLVLISRQHLNQDQAKEVFGLMSIVNDMESIGDIVEERILPLALSYTHGKYQFSEDGKKELSTYHKKVMKQVSRLGKFFSKFKRKRISKIIKRDVTYTEIERELRNYHLERVEKERKESVKTHEIHMELMDLLRQINGFITNIARTLIVILPEEVETTGEQEIAPASN